jgi:hypothetical protein
MCSCLIQMWRHIFWSKKKHLHQVCTLFKTSISLYSHEHLHMSLLFLLSPGDEIKGSEQAKIESIAEIETVGVKENVIADHKETGDNSGVSIHAPLLVESGQKASPGVELHGKDFSHHPIYQALIIYVGTRYLATYVHLAFQVLRLMLMFWNKQRWFQL